MNRAISLIIAALLLLGVVWLIAKPHLKEDTAPPVPKTTGLVAEQYQQFFESKAAAARLDALGITLKLQPIEGRNAVHELRFNEYDFVWSMDADETADVLNESVSAQAATTVGSETPIITFTDEGLALATAFNEDAQLRALAVKAKLIVDLTSAEDADDTTNSPADPASAGVDQETP